MIQQSLMGDVPNQREQSQWFTPTSLAKRIVEWVPITSGMSVLEPSAGKGSLVYAANMLEANVTAIEADPELCYDHGWHCADFLGLRPECFPGLELVLMNPPYEDDQDLFHVLHALRFAPIVVALVRLAFLVGHGRYRRLWLRHRPARIAYLVSRPSFIGAVNGSPRHDFCVIEWDVTKSGTVVEWWA